MYYIVHVYDSKLIISLYSCLISNRKHEINHMIINAQLYNIYKKIEKWKQ